MMLTIPLMGLAVCLFKRYSKPTKIMIIGDVHGCLDELQELVSQNSDRDQIYCVGDLVNRGPKSLETLKFCRDNNIQVLMGNHEDFLLTQIQVGMDTDFIKVDDLDQDTIDYVTKLPLKMDIPEYNLLLVHAGIDPTLPIDKQTRKDLLYIRDVDQNGKPCRKNKGTSWANYYKGPTHIIFGHDAKRGYQKYPFATCLDSGCVYGRKLTGILFPEHKIVQIQAKQVYWTKK